MNKIYITLFIILMSSFFSLEARPPKRPTINATSEQTRAYEDNKAIVELSESVRNNLEFDKLQSRAAYLELDKHKEFISFIKDVEDNVLPLINKKLDAWKKVYGATREKQDETYKKIFAGVYAQDLNIISHDRYWSSTLFSSNYENIKKRISHVDETRRACVSKLISDVNSSLSTISAVLPDYRGPIYEKGLQTLEIVLMYDPDNKEAKKNIKKIEKESESVLEARVKQIDKGRWPGQVKVFVGPGNVDALSEAALEWFKNDDRGWAKANPQLVAVKGDWISAQKNLLGQTIQWGLPIYLAVHKKQDTDIVRVFSLTILTAEDAGVEKNSPFTGAWVGDKFDMRLENLPGSSSSSLAKGPFILFRLLLSLLLIALGVVAASSKLSALNPNVKQFVDNLLPYKDMIGVSAAISGVLFFIKNLLFIAPFSDILPQLIAILVGIILGAKIFEEKTKDMKVPQKLKPVVDKVHDLFVQNKEKLDGFKVYEVQLGYICLVAGFFHLIAGSATFF